jgi:hypothetical protein
MGGNMTAAGTLQDMSLNLVIVASTFRIVGQDRGAEVIEKYAEQLVNIADLLRRVELLAKVAGEQEILALLRSDMSPATQTPATQT